MSLPKKRAANRYQRNSRGRHAAISFVGAVRFVSARVRRAIKLMICEQSTITRTAYRVHEEIESTTSCSEAPHFQTPPPPHLHRLYRDCFTRKWALGFCGLLTRRESCGVRGEKKYIHIGFSLRPIACVCVCLCVWQHLLLVWPVAPINDRPPQKYSTPQQQQQQLLCECVHIFRHSALGRFNSRIMTLLGLTLCACVNWSRLAVTRTASIRPKLAQFAR